MSIKKYQNQLILRFQICIIILRLVAGSGIAISTTLYTIILCHGTAVTLPLNGHLQMTRTNSSAWHGGTEQQVAMVTFADGVGREASGSEGGR